MASRRSGSSAAVRCWPSATPTATWQTLQWTAVGGGERFAGPVRHTAAAREWAYDRGSKIGRLDEAEAKGWTVADMAAEWRRVFPFAQP